MGLMIEVDGFRINDHNLGFSYMLSMAASYF